MKLTSSGVESKDVTKEIRKTKINAFRDKSSAVASPYEDEAYVRRRLGVSDDNDKFDVKYGAAILRRRDFRNGIRVEDYEK